MQKNILNLSVFLFVSFCTSSLLFSADDESKTGDYPTPLGAGGPAGVAAGDLDIIPHLVEVAKLFGWVHYQDLYPQAVLEGKLKEKIDDLSKSTVNKVIRALAIAGLSSANPRERLADQHKRNNSSASLEACANIWGYTLEDVSPSDELRVLRPFEVVADRSKTAEEQEVADGTEGGYAGYGEGSSDSVTIPLNWGSFLRDTDLATIDEVVKRQLAKKEHIIILCSPRILYSFGQTITQKTKQFYLAWLITLSEFNRYRLIMESYRDGYNNGDQVADRAKRRENPITRETAARIFAQSKSAVDRLFFPRPDAYKAVSLMGHLSDVENWYKVKIPPAAPPPPGEKTTQIILHTNTLISPLQPLSQATHYIMANADSNSCVPYSLVATDVLTHRRYEDLFPLIDGCKVLNDDALLPIRERVAEFRAQIALRRGEDPALEEEKSIRSHGTRFKEEHIQAAADILQSPIHIYRPIVPEDNVSLNYQRNRGALRATLHKIFSPAPVGPAAGPAPAGAPYKLLFIYGGRQKPLVPVLSHCQFII